LKCASNTQVIRCSVTCGQARARSLRSKQTQSTGYQRNIGGIHHGIPPTPPRSTPIALQYNPTGRTGTGARRTARPFKPIYTVGAGIVGDEPQAPEQPPAPTTTTPETTGGKVASAVSPVGTQTERPLYKPYGFSQASADLQNLLTSPVEDENGRGQHGDLSSELSGAADSRGAYAADQRLQCEVCTAGSWWTCSSCCR